MSEEEKKPAENLEPQAEEKKDASGQAYCGWSTSSTCPYNISNFGSHDPDMCKGRSSASCGYQMSYN